MISAVRQPAFAPSAAQQTADWGEHQLWPWQGHSCHWRQLGESHHPALVLVHGFGAASGHWRRNAPVLAQAGWCVYGVDLIGFGASSQPGHHRHRHLDNRFWARQLHGFLEQVVGRPAVLLGHSLGGLVSLSCSVFFPQWVRAVVAAPLPDPSLLLASLEAADRSPRRSPWRRRMRHDLVLWLCRLLPLELLVPLLARTPLLNLGIQSAYLQPVIGDRELHRLISRPARRRGAVRSLRAMSIGMALRPHQATAAPLLLRVCCPLLLVWGRQDRLVPIAVAQRCQKLRAGLPLVVVDQAGHCPHDETPETFNRAVLNWLAHLERQSDLVG